MAANTLPEPPVQLKNIQSFMKVASDIERIDPVVSYWVRLFSTETALKTDKDSPESKSFLSSLIVYLEKFKQTHKDNEAVSNETVGQAHMENFVVALFTKADTLDRNGTANKNTVRMFYMAAVLFEAMAVFGQLSEEITKKAKYAKFKAAYIQKCLKLGQTPKPGPIEGADLEDPSYNDGLADSADPTKSTGDNQDISATIGKPPEPFILEPKPTIPPYPKPTDHKQPSQPPQSPYSPSNFSKATSSSDGNTTSGTAHVTSTIDAMKFHATNGTPLKPEDLIQSQKYCKFANSALQYDDIPTAVKNLEKALKLLSTGEHID